MAVLIDIELIAESPAGVTYKYTPYGAASGTFVVDTDTLEVLQLTPSDTQSDVHHFAAAKHKVCKALRNGQSAPAKLTYAA